MRCIALQHLAFEDLGLFAPVLREAGWTIDYRQAGVSPLEPAEWREADLVVVLGGPIAAYDTGLYPFLHDEIAGLRSRLALGRPTLGLHRGLAATQQARHRRPRHGLLRRSRRGDGPVSYTHLTLPTSDLV